MRAILLGIAAGALVSGSAQADQFTDRVVSDLQSKGYSVTEIRQGTGQLKVEAVRGSAKLEVVYDTSTGRILKSQTGAAGSDDRRSGTEFSTRNRTFVDASDDGDDHGRDDDDDDDRSGGGDDSSGRSGGGDDSGGGHDDDDDDSSDD